MVAEEIDLGKRIAAGYKPTEKEQQETRELTLFGEDISDISALSRLSNLEKLRLDGTQVSDISALSGLTNLKSLRLDGTQVSTIKDLSELTNLENLYLNGTQVSDISALSGLTNLKSLSLSRTQVSDISTLSGLTNLIWLNLDGTKVSDISALSGLINLEYLYLYETQVSDISALSGLTNLEDLYLRGTQVSDISALSGLTNLKILRLNRTQVCDISALSGLTNLKELYLNETQVSDISALSGLMNLESLWLNRTQVSDISELSGMINLGDLYLKRTQVSDIGALSGLTNLKSLDLSGTQVSDISALSDLANLEELYLYGVQIDKLPYELIQNRKIYVENDTGFYFAGGIRLSYDTQLLQQPLSLFEQSKKYVDAYYKSDKRLVNEAKVIFLGDGGVGKTYTIDRICNNGEKGDYKTETTPGVSITKYKRDNRPVVNFWDFGGQEIMYSMHRCFLTERTCYVVVVSNRYSDVTKQAWQWLDNIRNFAPTASVILAVNRWDNVPVWDLNYPALQKEFPNLKGCVEYSARDDENSEFDKLTNAISTEVDCLNSIKLELPIAWADILDELRKNEKPYIDKTEYKEICNRHGLKVGEIRTWLLEWFNDLGVCFSYHKEAKEGTELADYKLLNPEWLTNAMYIIVNNGRDRAENGSIKRKSVQDTLKLDFDKGVRKDIHYDEKQECQYILNIMQKFNLAYQLPKRKDVFIPALCQNEEMDGLEPAEYKSLVKCELQYGYLPDNVVHQLMIRCYDKLDSRKRWLKGFCIEAPVYGQSAVCKMDLNGKLLHLVVYANDEDIKPYKLLQELLGYIREINTSMKLNCKTLIVAHKNQQTAKFDIRSLQKAKEQGRSTIDSTDDGEFETYSIDELLGMAYGDENVAQAQDFAQATGLTLPEVLGDFTSAILKMMEKVNETQENLSEQIQINNERIKQLMADEEKRSEFIREITEAVRIDEQENQKKGKFAKFFEGSGEVAKDIAVGVVVNVASTALQAAMLKWGISI